MVWLFQIAEKENTLKLLQRYKDGMKCRKDLMNYPQNWHFEAAMVNIENLDRTRQ